MKKFLVFMFAAASLFAEIKMDEEGMKKMGITLKPAVMSVSETAGPFVGSFDYDDAKSKNYILPSDGVLHGLSAGENLDVVAKFYEVSRDVILNEPLNGLNVTQFTDLSHPNIKPGTMLFVPGGTRPPAIWVTYVSAGEDGVGTHPNVSYLGSFACNSTATAYGTGAWQFPTTENWISGYDFTPPTHNGVDYAGRLGPILPYGRDFCDSCNRVRITARGQSHLCLFGTHGVELRDLLQQDEQQPLLLARIRQALKDKRISHFLHEGDAGITPHLAAIGG